ncbi:MAG: acyl-CoA synthetase [Methyloligella sp.]|nr:MAG: acyl-CoA synthetase [Methyloligella sp.]
MNIFENDTYLSPRNVNYRPLTPMQFLFRAEDAFTDRIAVIEGDKTYTWKEHGKRCRKLASSLRRRGIKKGDAISFLAPNTSAMLEAHFGVPLSGAVLNALNIRLDAAAIAFIVEHCEAKILFADVMFFDLAKEAVALLKKTIPIIVIEDPCQEIEEKFTGETYENFINEGSEKDVVILPENEWESISVNYTSGTTGDPKGVIYHHRGTYLNSLNQIINHGMTESPIYLWTLPLFHCNGWNFPWSIAAVGGTNVCLRQATAENIFNAIYDHGVTHLCSAPTVLTFIIEGSNEFARPFKQQVNVMTAGAAPPVAVLEKTEQLGFHIRHVYGMTEIHGVGVMCEEKAGWQDCSPNERAKLLSRQGVRNIITDEMIVANPETLEPVPFDEETMGEVMFKTNAGMKGYLKNPTSTEEAFKGGWYRSGDLAAVHKDGYIELKDRSKDIIISGGENISSIEIEDVLYTHPAVLYAAVVAMDDDKWNEVPCALIELNPGSENSVTEEDIITYCKENLAKFKVPKKVVFRELEKTATGKIRKFKLRSQI